MMRARLRRHRSSEHGGRGESEYVELDPAELTGVLSTPGWLRDVGVTAWLLVGMALFLVGAVWLLALTQTIVAPVITAAVVASVAAPLIRWGQGHGIPRGAGAVLLLLGLIALSAGVVVVVLAGITSQSGDLSGHLTDAKNTIEGWLKDLGVDPSKAQSAKDDASSAASGAVSTLLHGVEGGLKTLSSLVFFPSLTALSVLFLLKDGPMIRAWGERHLGVPLPVAQTISARGLVWLRPSTPW